MYKHSANTDYALRHLVGHLILSRNFDKLHSLLLQETADKKNAWFDIKTRESLIGSYADDLRTSWSTIVPNVSKRQVRDLNGATIRHIDYALIWASLNELVNNIPLEVIVTLVHSGIWKYEDVLNQINSFSEPSSIEMLLIKLAKKPIPHLFQEQVFNLANELPETMPRLLEKVILRPRVLSYLLIASEQSIVYQDWMKLARQINEIDKEFPILEPLFNSIPTLPANSQYNILEKFWHIYDSSITEKAERKARFINDIFRHLSPELKRSAIDIQLRDLLDSPYSYDNFNEVVHDLVMNIVNAAKHEEYDLAVYAVLNLTKKGFGLRPLELISEDLPKAYLEILVQQIESEYSLEEIEIAKVIILKQMVRLQLQIIATNFGRSFIEPLQWIRNLHCSCKVFALYLKILYCPIDNLLS